MAVANSFALRPQGYQERVESVFALLAVDAKLIMDAITILEGIEQDLSQWYGNRQLVV